MTARVKKFSSPTEAVHRFQQGCIPRLQHFESRIADLPRSLWIFDHSADGSSVILRSELAGPSQVFNRADSRNILCGALLIGGKNHRNRGQPQAAPFPHGGTTSTDTKVSVEYQIGHIGYLAVEGQIRQLIT